MKLQSRLMDKGLSVMINTGTVDGQKAILVSKRSGSGRRKADLTLKATGCSMRPFSPKTNLEPSSVYSRKPLTSSPRNLKAW